MVIVKKERKKPSKLLYPFYVPNLILNLTWFVISYKIYENWIFFYVPDWTQIQIYLIVIWHYYCLQTLRLLYEEKSLFLILLFLLNENNWIENLLLICIILLVNTHCSLNWLIFTSRYLGFQNIRHNGLDSGKCIFPFYTHRIYLLNISFRQCKFKIKLYFENGKLVE